MNDKIRNLVGGAVVVGVIAFAYAALWYVKSYSKSIEPSSFRSFAVSAEGKATAIPDVASFSFSVVTQGSKDIASLISENTNKVNNAIAFVKGTGVEAKDIKTTAYNLEPRYQYFSCPANKYGGDYSRPCPPPEIVGYTVTQSVSVKVRDFTKIGDILSGVVENGANTVSGLSFTVDEPEKLELQARAEAIAKAKVKAGEIAKAGGFSVGRLLSIDEGYVPVPYYRAAAEFGGKGGEGPVPAPVIEPGSQEITMNVTMRYEIE